MRPFVESIAAARGLSVVAASDAHVPPEVRRAYTLLEAAVLTIESVVDAIRDPTNDLTGEQESR
ncbi:PHP-associated domain-containing protein [Natronorubrum sp. FCH18a]|uniref:PHP-associated domain-containing protein n=1 Tax=Natronorubrum sp. FCH18a TaxID=3447018 RepID=UPI003F511565